MTSNQSRDKYPWMTLVATQFSDGVILHPRLPDIVQKDLGRMCAINTVYETGISLSYINIGDDYWEAKADQDQVTNHLLEITGLNPENIVLNQLILRKLISEFNLPYKELPLTQAARPSLKLLKS